MRLAGCQVPFSLYAPIAAGMDGRNTYPGHAVLLGTLAAAGALAGMDAPADGFAQARHLALGLDHEPVVVTPPGDLAARGSLHQALRRRAPRALRGGRGDRTARRARPAAGRGARAVTLATYAEALRYAANRAPASAIAAQFSLSWAVAAALLQGDLGPAAYTDAALADPALRGLEALVVLIEDLSLTGAGRRGASLAVTLQDGTVLQAARRPGAGRPGPADERGGRLREVPALRRAGAGGGAGTRRACPAAR